ncbi:MULTISPECIES: D-glycero-alpha-D-manno-heptose-1,7-bisphosphate 7-phosphatase [Nostocales]|uniref:D,D-heptose 1,7-bisphosphate phosphatase n=3 Tax=Nostocales TaxID=1161 RepID=A0A0C1N312_9CYAN|nr:HAD family hydrolase [Tolypothrix bouteillei]KAF3885354.1 HAD family hydrolase [Tolypothrix bouteillei VB521301]
MLNKTVFLDKDGTLIEDVPYNVDPKYIKLAPGAIEGLRLLNELGYELIVITNQSGVARRYFQESALVGVEEHLRNLFGEFGINLSGFYYCPHHPDGVVSEFAIACDCRKPAPGMLLRAARDRNIDLHASWFIGDILNDVEAGHRAGCKTILINNGNETEWELSPLRTPDFIVSDLAEAAQAIFSVDSHSEYRGELPKESSLTEVFR